MGTTDLDIVLSGHTNDVNSCDFSADGLLVTSSSDKTVRAWSRPPSSEEFVEAAFSPLTYHTYGVHCVRFSPSGASFISCSTDGTAVIWNAKTGVTLSVLRHPSQLPLRTCCFSPDGTLVVTAGDDGDVCVWSTDQPSLLLTLRGHEETVPCAAFSADGGQLVTGSLSGELRLWQPRAGQAAAVAAQPAAHDLGVTCCHFRPRRADAGDSDVLASGGNDCAVRLWTVLPSGAMSPLTALETHTGAVMAVRFSPDGGLLASAGGDKTIRLWNTSTWTQSATLHGHTRYVTCCCFSPDGRLLVSGSNDKAVRVRPVQGAGPAAGGGPGPSAPPPPPPPRQVADWSCQDVSTWLRSLGLAQYTAACEERSVNGAELLKLTEDRLQNELGVELVGHRNKLLRQIARLSEPRPASAGAPPPDEFYCPITREIMREPVVCSDGYSYERAAISAWLRERISSPMTNEPLKAVMVVPNHALRSLIGQWRLQRGQ